MLFWITRLRSQRQYWIPTHLSHTTVKAKRLPRNHAMSETAYPLHDGKLLQGRWKAASSAVLLWVPDFDLLASPYRSPIHNKSTSPPPTPLPSSQFLSASSCLVGSSLLFSQSQWVRFGEFHSKRRLPKNLPVRFWATRTTHTYSTCVQAGALVTGGRSDLIHICFPLDLEAERERGKKEKSSPVQKIPKETTGRNLHLGNHRAILESSSIQPWGQRGACHGAAKEAVKT